ncbi:MAG: homogentisate 1,2-dioxygenase, partial [Burkholderiaceae bacterium]
MNTQYMSGFANEFATEALPGALPKNQNSPQQCAYGLYAEQISGTAFTAPRHSNRRSWTYRIRPAAMHQPFVQIDNGNITNDFSQVPSSPNQLRWDPQPMPSTPTDFIEGWLTMAGNGSADAQTGCAIHMYAANKDMTDKFFYDADAELLIIPQQGRLHLKTEMGLIDIEPHEIAVIPRGVRFQVTLPDGEARGRFFSTRSPRGMTAISCGSISIKPISVLRCKRPCCG